MSALHIAAMRCLCPHSSQCEVVGGVQVKFFVDGRWTADPQRSVVAISRDFNVNKVVTVPPKEVSADKALQAVSGGGVHPLHVPIGLEGSRRQ